MRSPDYEREGIKLYLGDCLEILPLLEAGSVDAVVTDPPYGISHSSNYVCETTTAEWVRDVISNDEDTEVRDKVIEWCGARPWAVFGSIKRSVPEGTRGTLVWDKGVASGMGDLTFPWKPSFELIFVGGREWQGRRDEGVIKNAHITTRKSMGRVHPNEKPVGLMRHLIAKLPPSFVVCDPFMGSGTTGVACLELGRSFIGIEKEPKYFEIAAQRIERQLAQPQLFIA